MSCRALNAAAAPLACLVSSASSRPADDGAQTQRHVRSADLDKIRLGETTPSEVEQLFGAPDVRGADGSITYGTAPAAPTVTFRFENGTVSKICRTRP